MKRFVLSALMIAILITLVSTISFGTYTKPLTVNLACFTNCMADPVGVCLAVRGGVGEGYICTSEAFEADAFCCQYCGGGVCPQMPSPKVW